MDTLSRIHRGAFRGQFTMGPAVVGEVPLVLDDDAILGELRKSPVGDPVASNPRKRYAWDHDFNPGSGGGGGF